MLGRTLFVPLAASLLAPAQAQTMNEPAGFRSIELQGGGIVTVRHGSTREVTVSYENPGRRIRVDGDRLVIPPCSGACRRDHHIEVDIVTPAVSSLAVTDGGIIHVVGDFPRQAAATATVNGGGTVDIRWLEADDVSASVSHGGRILARPARGLAASISDGGSITYWRDPVVTSSVRRGGVVEQGAPEQLRVPLHMPRRIVPVLRSGGE